MQLQSRKRVDNQRGLCDKSNCYPVSTMKTIGSDSQQPQQLQPASQAKGWAMAGIAALILLNPFTWLALIVVAMMGFVAVLMGGLGCAALVQQYGFWCLAPLLILSLLGPIRERLSGKHQAKLLEQRLNALQTQMTETQMQLLHTEHELDYYKQITDKEP